MNLSMYPPQLEGQMPAFAIITGENTIITVPYILNKAIGINDFTHMCLMMKTVTTGTIKLTIETSECKIYNNSLKSYCATFTIPTSNDFQPIAGNYYKIQIAFKNSTTSEQSAWSNVSVIKCTKQPILKIDSLTPAIDNINPDIFIGSYINSDTTEKVYAYNFTIYDTDNNIYESSGDLIHNGSTDEIIAGVGVKSTLRWQPTKSLKDDIRYRIALNITTINSYQATTGPYIIRAASTVNARIPAKLLATPDYDNGCVHLSLIKLNSLTAELPFSGRFVISRYDSQANLWREVCRFNMLSQTPTDIGEIWTDYTIEHGVKYLYALQAYNDNKLYSNRMIHVIPGVNSYLEYDELGAPYYITSDFEDMFLTDGERQLRIRYNPKVSSYKTTMLESKMETMGSKYPFIFRNGSVCYKEFPISGLLSYLTDEKELFMTGIHPAEDKFVRSHSAAITNPETYKEWMTTPGAGTKLTSENFYRERQFKTNVLDWLNNGKPKLFRSPGEGSYIVRLMNVSLSPNETLGRMLHTFNAQAYEIAPCDFDHLKEFNLLSIPEIDNRVMKFRSVKLSEVMNVDLYSPGYEMYSIYITDASPGTKYTFSFAGLPASSSVTYTIGITGALSLDADVAPVASIVKNTGDIYNTATLHYGYYDTSVPDNFSHITNITISDAMAQVIGYDDTKNIITDKLQDIRKEVGTIYSIVIKPRHITKIYSRSGEYYRHSMFITKITQGWDETEIYFVVNETTFYSGNPHNKVILGHQMPKQYFKLNDLYIIDLSTGNAFLSSDPMKNTLNTNPLAAQHFVQLTQGSYYVTGDFETIHSIHLSPGVYVELAYAQKEIEYSVEATNDNVKAAKTEWLLARENYITSNSATDYAIMNTKYDTYINLLEVAVAEAQMEVHNYVL